MPTVTPLVHSTEEDQPHLVPQPWGSQDSDAGLSHRSLPKSQQHPLKVSPPHITSEGVRQLSRVFHLSHQEHVVSEVLWRKRRRSWFTGPELQSSWKPRSHLCAGHWPQPDLKGGWEPRKHSADTDYLCLAQDLGVHTCFIFCCFYPQFLEEKLDQRG